MNGYIILKSKEGEGSTFSVYLSGIEIPNVINPQRRHQQNTDFGVFNPSKVLIVDDIDYNRELLKGMFDNTNLIIFEAENGLQAVEMSLIEFPDIILMDIKMPVMDGIDATKLIKGNIVTSGIPIIAITASGVKEDEDFIFSNCDGYIRKPVSYDELFNELLKFLDFDEKNLSLNLNADFSDFNISIENDFSKIPAPKELIETLKILVEDRISNLIDYFVLDEIEKFVQEILNIGNEYSYIRLINFAEELISDIQTFDIEQIERKLKNMKKFINEIENIPGN
jgi:CheY-like chemotaxis protein